MKYFKADLLWDLFGLVMVLAIPVVFAVRWCLGT